jgi:sugar phosphate isomerase/epimerase
MSVAERSAAYRARRKAEAEAAGKPVVCICYRQPTDRRSRPKRWADAVETLADLLDDYQAWRDRLCPPAWRTARSPIGWMNCCICAIWWTS